MASDLVLNPIGILLAGIFALFMASLLFWVFRVPPPAAQEVAHARRGVSGIKRVLVPARGAEHDEKTVDHACRLGQEQKSEIVLTYVLEIPLTHSLGTPLAAEEAKANRAGERSIGIVKLHSLEAIPRVERDREAGRGILRIAKDLDVDFVVIGTNPARSNFSDPLGRTTETLPLRANFEVIVDKHPVSLAA